MALTEEELQAKNAADNLVHFCNNVIVVINGIRVTKSILPRDLAILKQVRTFLFLALNCHVVKAEGELELFWERAANFFLADMEEFLASVNPQAHLMDLLVGVHQLLQGKVIKDWLLLRLQDVFEQYYQLQQDKISALA